MPEKNSDNNPLDIVKGREQEIGPLLGIFTIVILLVIGAIYFWNNELKKNSGSSQATTTEIIIDNNNVQTGTSTVKIASSTDNAKLDSIKNNLEGQLQDINNLNF